MIESVASVAIHGSSFVKASSRFVDFFISDTICRDYYANLPFFLDDDEKEEKEDGDGAITEAGPNSIATPAALRPRLRSNRPQKDGPADIQMTDAETFAEWYSNAHAFQRLVTGLFQKTFLYGPDHLFFNTEDNRRKLFTQPTMSQPARLLQAEEMWFLQYNLSQGTAMSNDAWARVYTARTDGNSWNNFSSKLRASRGSTVILIRDTDGHTFGAYTEDTWKLQPDFYGKDSCALFSLRPTMAWYRPTGTNQNYQVGHLGCIAPIRV